MVCLSFRKLEKNFISQITPERKSFFVNLFPVLIVVGFYIPFLNFIALDGDALITLGAIRDRSSYFVYMNGYYLNGLLTGIVNIGLNQIGVVSNHYLFAYKLVVLGCLIGVITIVYQLLKECIDSSFWRIVLIVVLGTNPGILSLLAVFEDNIPSEFFNMQYLYMYVLFVKINQGNNINSSLRKTLLTWGLPVSLTVAIMDHRQLIILLITPLFLYFFLPSLSRGRRIFEITKIYLIACVLFSLFYLYLAQQWLPWGKFNFEFWISCMRDWFIPGGGAYRKCYFFNNSGWNIPYQTWQIRIGISKIFSSDFSHSKYLFFLYGIILFSFFALKNNSNDLLCKLREKIFLLFIAVHIPHSLIYESSSLERWDVEIPCIILLIGAFTGQLCRRGSILKNFKLSLSDIFIAIFGSFILYTLFDFPDSLKWSSLYYCFLIRNSDQWYILIPCFILFLGIFFSKFGKFKKLFRSYEISWGHVLLAAFTLIIFYNIYSYFVVYKNTKNWNDSMISKDFLQKLEVNIQPKFNNRPTALILNEKEFNGDRFMVAQAYFKCHDIFHLSPDGKIFKPKMPSSIPQEITLNDFKKALQGKNIILAYPEKLLLEKLVLLDCESANDFLDCKTISN